MDILKKEDRYTRNYLGAIIILVLAISACKENSNHTDNSDLNVVDTICDEYNICIVKHENGNTTTFEINTDNQLSGEYVETSSNGDTLVRGKYKNGNRVGRFEEYYEDGSIKCIDMYQPLFIKPSETKLSENVCFTNSGDTLYENSYFYRKSPVIDSIKLNVEPFNMKIWLPRKKFDHLNGYYKFSKASEFGQSFELEFIRSKNDTLQIFKDRFSEPGKYILCLIGVDYKLERVDNADSIFKTYETEIIYPFTVY
jgi:hypothetical protein